MGLLQKGPACNIGTDFRAHWGVQFFFTFFFSYPFFLLRLCSCLLKFDSSSLNFPKCRSWSVDTKSRKSMLGAAPATEAILPLSSLILYFYLLETHQVCMVSVVGGTYCTITPSGHILLGETPSFVSMNFVSYCGCWLKHVLIETLGCLCPVYQATQKAPYREFILFYYQSALFFL